MSRLLSMRHLSTALIMTSAPSRRVVSIGAITLVGLSLLPISLGGAARAESVTDPIEPSASEPLVATNVADLSSTPWTVPAGVEVVQLVATGASGGGSSNYLGGPGCETHGSVPVSAGKVISAVIGEMGGNGQTSGGTLGFDFAGGVGGAGAFAGGNGGQAWTTGSNNDPFNVSIAGGGGGGGATGIKVGDDYKVVGAGGSGASGDYQSRQDSQCFLIKFPRSFGNGGLPGMGGSPAEGGSRTTSNIPYPYEGGKVSQGGGYHIPCGGPGTVSARPGADGGDPGDGVGGQGADAGSFFQGGTCTDSYLNTSGRAGGGGGGGWQGGGGGASSSSINKAGTGGPGIGLAPKTPTESADFKTATPGTSGKAEVRWASINTTLPAQAAVPGSSVAVALSAKFGNGTPYVSIGYTAAWRWSATGLPAGLFLGAISGVLYGTVPVGAGTDITVTAEYQVESWNPDFTTITKRAVAKSSRVYRIGPTLLPTALTYTGPTGPVDGPSYVLSSTVNPPECTANVLYTVTNSGGTVMFGPAVASTLDVSGWAAGEYTVTASYPADSVCAAATASATFTLSDELRTVPIGVSATSPTITFGVATPTDLFTATGFDAGDDWVTQPQCTIFTRDITPAVVAVSPIPAGTYDIICTGGNPGEGYEVSEYINGVLTVNKADAVCSVTGYNVTYNGLDHISSGQCTGIDGTPLSGLDLSGTTHQDAGTYTVDPWTFTDETGNYNDITDGKVTNTILKATPTLIYGGTAGVATVGETGVLGAGISPEVCNGVVTYTLTYSDGDPIPLTTNFDTTGWTPGVYIITAVYTADANCNAATDSGTLVIGGPGDSTTGGGRYKVNSSISGSPRVNFGYTVQKTVTTNKRTNLTTTNHRGQLLWTNSQAWRVKASVDTSVVTDSSGAVISGGKQGFMTIPCPTDVGTALPDSKPKCGVINATGTLQKYNAETGGWDTVLSGDVPAMVYITVTIYDGGSVTVCKMKRCTVTNVADWFGLQILGVSVENQVPVGAPIKVDNGQNGQIIIRSN